MTRTENVISIKILDRTYKIKCPLEQAQALQEAAHLVDEQMQKMRQTGNMTSIDRLAVVVALNISHELMILKKQKNQYIDEMNERILDLQQRIQKVVNTDEEVVV